MLEAGTHDPRELAEAARRVIVPGLLRRRSVLELQPAIFDPDFEAKLVAGWCRYSAAAPDPATAFALRARIEAYAARIPRDRAAVVCTAALRPVLADFLLRCGARVAVYAYGELPNEIVLAPSEVITEKEADVLVAST